jgi:predicted Zn-dependent peptidase
MTHPQPLPPSDAASGTITRLSNGVRVVSHHMPHVETVSLGVWVDVGARHENATENGISHFLEHMAFKGTGRRTARAIAEEIEQVGGELNAATGLDTTAYFARVLKADVGLAFDIIADILLNPSYSADEIEREREVILQEIAATRDSPDEIAYDLLNEVAYPEQSLGRAILGTTETVSSFTAPTLRGFLGENYTADTLVIAAVGHVDHAAVVRHAEALFGGLKMGKGAGGDRFAAARYTGGTRASSKSFEQSHLLMGFEGPSYRDPEFYTAQVFSGLFGGGMSSRLFQEVREHRGLCYSIYSSCWGLGDTGLFTIHAATGHTMLPELIDVVRAECHRVAATAPEVREVDRAKAQLKAGLLMSLESSGARVEQVARQTLRHGRLISVDELVARVDAVKPESIRTFAATMLAGKPPSVTIVGAGKKSASHAARAAEPFAKPDIQPALKGVA